MAGKGDQIQRIYTKLQQLLKRFDALQKDNLRLKQSVESLQAEKIASEETIRELRLRNDVLKATRSKLSDEEKKSLDKKINQYVKEIDRCISSIKT
jgi:predicted nuclease with TOPRIM domain